MFIGLGVMPILKDDPSLQHPLQAGAQLCPQDTDTVKHQLLDGVVCGRNIGWHGHMPIDTPPLL